MALTKEQMDAYTTLAKDGFAFFVNEHSPTTGHIVATRRFRQWVAAVTAFQQLAEAGTPASISLTKSANTDRVRLDVGPTLA